MKLTNQRFVKLDESDYINIYSRVRDRLIFWIIGIIVSVAAILSISSYYAAQSSIQKFTENQVKKFIQSKDFQENVVTELRTNLQELEDRSSAMEKQVSMLERLISDKEVKIAELSEFPIVISDSKVKITNPNSDRLLIQSGSALQGTVIKFEETYKTRPIVFITFDSQSAQTQLVKNDG